MPKDALIRLDELDAQRSKLVEQAKSEILQTIQEAIDRLDSLGFSYALVERAGVNGFHHETAPAAKPKAKAVTKRSTARSAAPKRGGRKGARRTGIRQDVLAAIAASGKKGMTRGDLIGEFGAKDKAFQQSISNALVALKKQKQVKATGGVYKAA
jgi:hypothetical protein